MKKLSYLLLVALISLSMPTTAKELPAAEGQSIFCELLGIGCSIVVNQPESDGNGNGKEPPKKD